MLVVVALFQQWSLMMAAVETCMERDLKRAGSRQLGRPASELDHQGQKEETTQKLH